MPTSIARDEVQRLVAEEGAQIVDVLPPTEYADAVNIPLRMLDRETTAQLDRARPVIVY